ncbi:putative bifunctional diguanylate cyclase/phosphodiesterase [Vibrio mangrovi]|uniref:GGDEF domain-containing phosphodiesterase n=1 Tax=Vibrio mangrovi TaxID=474394 RepID=A0A1Y6IZ03_9VIBR|nr:GGDEF domain-containing phosphodiesterase [Vibrio mangrovi]MDW6005279.1 GGDEF domain-containing phosphodiesterase [Vibrio mangrovi]SMS02905.1 Phytochrome-like protein cph2 [Vibrio mangrovi]
MRENIAEFGQLHPEINGFSVSIGLSVYPEDAIDSQSLVLHADAALHKAKVDSYHEGICFYSEEMESKSLSRRAHYAQIKNAISHQRVIALYQPMVNPFTGDVEAVEALMRIRDEAGNTIPPVEFISLAEETRLIIPLGEQMIHLALAQLKEWHENELSIRLCLNISPVQFLDPHFVPFLLSAIEHYGVKPSMIELEVTESLMLQNLQQIIRDMMQFRQLGISISIDDFGTGYSCLSYLKELPVDVLKIDKAFINQISTENPDEALVQTIAQLAIGMSLQSVAEGVESRFQAQRLKDIGVSLLQGYYFSRPVPAKDIQKNYPL